ncbi:helix-turn-helix domain-containing protein [Mesobacillus subterraneus]|uniref:helix-turn-helix domain-containing protein n=1 Tax=Mesobacillus subterraneus TaxID=285983 RepID=UPI001CFCF60A|nr:helix-turn-helix domain-containing protein [Mesobacillus subterraneus]WLR54168.1 helix-turn-helix domain-containing protein [Mesobacillus subterraneus]
MYLTVKEAAEYLSIPESKIEKMIFQQKIRAIHDGDHYLIYKDQFNTHMKQMEKYKKLVEEIMNEPVPEDIDIKDED